MTMLRWWRSYRFRFVPWLAVHAHKKLQRPPDVVSPDPCLLLSDIKATLTSLAPPDASLLLRHGCRSAAVKRHASLLHQENSLRMLRSRGFSLRVSASGVCDGRGVFVDQGEVAQGQVVALYPGATYLPGQPVLLQSVANPYILRCCDGVLVDGNHRGLSRIVYSSCFGRDRAFHSGTAVPTCDITWIANGSTGHSVNPLNVGQIVNNGGGSEASNVCYSECDLPADFEPQLRLLIPNVSYSPDFGSGSSLRLVPLVATRNIRRGEELLSSYFSLAH